MHSQGRRVLAGIAPPSQTVGYLLRPLLVGKARSKNDLSIELLIFISYICISSQTYLYF